jgi:beta-lactamase class A
MARRSTASKITAFIVYIFVCVLIGVGIFWVSEKMESPSAPHTVLVAESSASAAVQGIQSTSPLEPSPTDTPLGSAVMKALEGTKGEYAVGIKNLKTGEEFYLNEHKSFDSGSLYKLWVMGETLHKVETNQLMLEDVLSSTIPELNRIFEISPENAELTEGGITMSVNQALNQMITISHNYAAMLLTQKNKVSTIRDWITDKGFKDSSVGGQPSTTAHDMVLFFDKLQKGELANAENTQKMLEFLKKQQLNDKIPADLPNNIVIAHKTGELGLFSHDAGIVYTPKGDYIIAVLSKSDTPAAAEKRIADVSKAVYDYFQK